MTFADLTETIWLLFILTKIILLFLSVLSLRCIQAQNAAFCPAPNGMFTNPNSRTCRSFIRCTNGIGVFQRCRRGTIFNGQQCIPGNQNTCNRVNANNLNNPASFGGFRPANLNPWGPNIIGQPGMWGTGAQPLPGVWNNGQLQNRRGFGGQGNLRNPWNNRAAAQWNNGATGGGDQFRGFNPGLLAVWFDGNWNPESTDDPQMPNVNNREHVANTGNKRTTR